MKAQEFDKLLSQRIIKMTTVLGSKAGEYASDKDRLHNFKAAGCIDGVTPEEALLGMLRKHLVCVIEMLKNPDAKYSDFYIDEKFGDTINYLVLAEALLKERTGYNGEENGVRQPGVTSKLLVSKVLVSNKLGGYREGEPIFGPGSEPCITDLYG